WAAGATGAGGEPPLGPAGGGGVAPQALSVGAAGPLVGQPPAATIARAASAVQPVTVFPPPSAASGRPPILIARATSLADAAGAAARTRAATPATCGVA